MKKQLLIGTALFATMSVFSQSNRVISKPAGIADMKKEKALNTVGVNEPVSPMLGSGQLQPQSNTSQRPTNISWQLLTGSSNVYGMLVSTSRPLQYNPALNAISFIHRKSDYYVESPALPSTAETGAIVANISTDWGATWDSTLIWSDATNWGRYPQGAIYNPANNTNIANAYVVGCGPTVSGSNFTGNFYASKQLNAFTNVASTAPGAQQFLSFTLPTYPANQHQHGWSRNGFSSTNDGIVRSIGVIEDDLQALSTVRGFAVVTGTFNGTAFDWSVDSLIPNTFTDGAGDKHLRPDPQMAFNQAGTVGYIVGLGALTTGTLANRGFQPIIYKMDKTVNANATWTLMTGIDFNSTAMRPIVIAHSDRDMGLAPMHIIGSDTVGVPFVNDYDIAVDANNKLHIGATLMSTFSDVPDSLNFISTFTTSINPSERYKWRHTPGSRPYLYDFIGDGVAAWDYRLVDSMSTEGPSSALGQAGYAENPWDPTGTGSAKVGMDSRVQLGRTPSGDFITFSWSESDTLFTNSGFKWNNLPDIKARLMAVNSGTGTYVMDAGPAQNMTSNDNNVRTRATLHYMSPITSAASVFTAAPAVPFYTVDVKVPFTVTNSNPYSQLTNNATWFGGGTSSFSFRKPVVNTTGLADNAGILATSNIYPNPARNSAVVTLALDFASVLEVNVMNTIGQNVKTIKTQGTVGENAIGLDLSNLTSGVYLVNIKAGTATTTKKLIVQ